MKKVKLLKDFLGLEIGSVLSLNESTNNYEYDNEERVVDEKGSYTTNKKVTVSRDTVELWLDEIFEEIAIVDITDFKYVKPLIVKCWFDKESNLYVLQDIHKEIFKLKSNVFDKLYKIIE